MPLIGPVPDIRSLDLLHSVAELGSIRQAALRRTMSQPAATGATTAELMHRAGHSSAAAALRYQHATHDRDRVLADALESLIKPAEVIPLLREPRAPTAD